MGRAKITIVGAGNVGATCAHWCAAAELGDIVLVDVPVTENMPKGKALDLMQASPIMDFDSNIVGTTEYGPSANSDVVVITAGIARKPGMSRDDLVKTNAGIVRSVSEQIARVAPKAIVVVVSNPLDVMCYVAMKTTRFPRERIVGMAGVLDTARYRTFLAEAMNVSVKDIQAMVLGGHGDTMVPLVSYTTVSGIPVTQLLEQSKLGPILDRTRNGGAEIVAFLKTGSAYYAPSAAAVEMVEAIALDRRRLLPCSAWLQGEFGLRDVFCGVPCLLGRKGLERILEITLTDQERADLHKSAEAVRGMQAVVDR